MRPEAVSRPATREIKQRPKTREADQRPEGETGDQRDGSETTDRCETRDQRGKPELRNKQKDRQESREIDMGPKTTETRDQMTRIKTTITRNPIETSLSGNNSLHDIHFKSSCAILFPIDSLGFLVMD